MLNAIAFYDLLIGEGFQPELVEDDEEIIIACPLCSDDRARLYVNVERGTWICFHCSEQGSLYRFLTEVLSLTASVAFNTQMEMTSQSDAEADDFFDVRPAEKAKVTEALTLPMSFQPIAGAPVKFLNYLNQRGISEKLATGMGIGFSVSGRYAHRVIVPVINDGHLHTFIARTILTNCPNCSLALNACTCLPIHYPKVLTPSTKHGATPSLALYNLDNVRRYGKGSPVVLMEGWADTLMLPRYTLSIMGSRASQTQLTLLAGIGRTRGVTLCLDPDASGYTGAYKIAEALAAELVPVKVAMLPEGVDANALVISSGLEALTRCISAAKAFNI